MIIGKSLSINITLFFQALNVQIREDIRSEKTLSVNKNFEQLKLDNTSNTPKSEGMLKFLFVWELHYGIMCSEFCTTLYCAARIKKTIYNECITYWREMVIVHPNLFSDLIQ